MGHHVTSQGIVPLPSKVAAVQEYVQPSDAKGLERFLGMLNFYHGFVPHAAEKLQPLYQALSGKPRPKTLHWTEEMTKAFHDTKKALDQATMLHHPVQGAQTSLTSDALDTAVGAVLEQKLAGKWRPLAFFSRQLRKPERKYATFDKELLGIFLVIKHFRYFLEGQKFTVFTDHGPIVGALHKSSEPSSARQARQLATIAEATTDIQYIDGKDNVVADTLSRVEDGVLHRNCPPLTMSSTDGVLHQNGSGVCVPSNPDIDVEDSAPSLVNLPFPGRGSNPPMVLRACSIQRGLDYQALAADQALDPDVQAYRTALTNLKIRDIVFANGAFKVLCDISMGSPRPIVPESWRRRVFDTVHALAHPGARTTKRLIASKLVWHGLNKQVTGWARSCLNCQRSKVHIHTRAPLKKFEPTQKRFDHVHIDIVGLLPESQGNKYLLTVIDRFTRWPEAIPIKDIEARTIARAYVHSWVARFGVPNQMTSDRGTQFVSELWSAMSDLLGTTLNPTTAYHPQANGLVERLHRTLKASLKARLTCPTWMDELPWVLLGLRTTPKEDLNASPADLVYGAPLTVPGDFIPEAAQTPVQDHLRKLRQKVDNLRPTTTSAHGAENVKPKVPVALTSAKFVFIRKEAKKPLEPPYTGPYEVLERSEKYFKLQIGSRQDKVSIDRLKVALVDQNNPVQVAQPPKRGRPPTKNNSSNQKGVQSHSSSKQTLDHADQMVQNPQPDRPTYAEITTRSGRATKAPDKYTC